MTRWVDVTSPGSRIERRHLEAAGITIIRNMSTKKSWVLSAKEFGIIGAQLGTIDEDTAKRLALKVITEKLEDQIKERQRMQRIVKDVEAKIQEGDRAGEIQDTLRRVQGNV